MCIQQRAIGTWNFQAKASNKLDVEAPVESRQDNDDPCDEWSKDRDQGEDSPIPVALLKEIVSSHNIGHDVSGEQDNMEGEEEQKHLGVSENGNERCS